MLLRVPAVHQPISDAGFGQSLATGRSIVSFVGEHRRLIADDQGVGSDTVADVSAGQDYLADQIASPAAAS